MLSRHVREGCKVFYPNIQRIGAVQGHLFSFKINMAVFYICNFRQSVKQTVGYNSMAGNDLPLDGAEQPEATEQDTKTLAQGLANAPGPEENVNIFQVTGFVKWFDVARGYGFIIPDSGIRDVLIHLSCLLRDGFTAPLEGTRVVCEVVERQKGYQCLRVLDVDTSTAINPVERVARTHVDVEANAEWRKATVKWFNRTRGFGFATEGEGAPDIFIHMETLRKTAIAELMPDQIVYVRFGDGPKGKMAAEVRLSLNDDMPKAN